MTTRSLARTALLLALAASAAPAPLAAQDAAQDAGARTAVDADGPRNVISTNPILFVFGWFTGEYERRIGTGTTLALGASYFEYGDDDEDGEEEYASADVKLRYYPNERVFRGFSLGASAGVARVVEVEDVFADDEESATGLTLGLAMDYGWLIGRRDNVHIDLGVGARRFIYEDDGALDDALETLPYLRFSVGIAF